MESQPGRRRRRQSIGQLGKDHGLEKEVYMAAILLVFQHDPSARSVVGK